MNPRAALIEAFFLDRYPGNVWKRMDRVDRLAHEIGAEVYYGMTCEGNIGIRMGDDYYEVTGLRRAESVLRHLKQNQ